MSKSIGTLNATLRADAVQFLSELERADQAVRSHGTSMEQSINHTIEHIERKFSLARFAHGFLASFGIGSGAAIVEHAIEGVRQHFEEIEKTTKSIEEGWKEIAKIQIEISHIGESDDDKRQRLQNIINEYSAQAKLVSDKLAEEFRRQAEAARALSLSPSHIRLGNPPPNESLRDTQELEANKKITEIKTARAKIEKELAELEHKISGEAQAAQLKKLAAATAEQTRENEEMLRAQKHIREEMAKQDKELETKARLFADLADPMKKYRDQLDELDIIQRSKFALSAEAAAAAVRHIHEEMQKLQDSLVNQKLKEFFGPLDEESKNISKEIEKSEKVWDKFGEHASSAIENMIIEGKSFRDTWRTIMKDVQRAIYEAFIGDQIKGLFKGAAKGLFGDDGIIGKILGRAGGGNVSAGELSVVGENGPELFQPSTSGLVLNNSSSNAFAGGGKGGGDTFVIDARGADPAGLARLEAMIRSVNGSIEHRAISANLAYSRRTTPNYQPTA